MIKEYWVDVETTGSFEKEDEEQFIDRTGAEGFASSITLGLPAMEPADPKECDAESGCEESGTEAPSVRVPPKVDCEKEHVIEACHLYDFTLLFDHFSTLYPCKHFLFFSCSPKAVESVNDVVTNLLRVQGRMDALRSKLLEIKTPEATELLECKASNMI